MSDQTWSQAAWAGSEQAREDNRQWWDERVPIHVDSAFYAVDRARIDAGGSSLQPFEVAELGDLSGRSLVHLQCHFGLDTLSCARLGAEVTGLDFSPPAIAAARALATELRVDATFVEGDVYDAPALLGRRYDVVYTGKGALNWLPDIDRWAAVVAALTAPGGRLYLSEFHPLSWISGDVDLAPEHDYFRKEDALVIEEPGTYALEAAATIHNRTGEWNHPIGDIVTALADHGFSVRFLRERDFTLFPRWPILEARPDGTYHFPPGHPSLPLLFSLEATTDPGS